jgi:hypothetical protein
MVTTQEVGNRPDGAGGRYGRGPGRSRLVERLNAEWVELGRAHPEATERWSGRHAALAACRALDDVADRVDDPALHALLTESGQGDRLAARAVVQILLGRLVRMGRHARHCGVDDLVSALWCVVVTYPLAQRPARLAANLTLDALKLATSEHRWLRQGEVSPWPPERLLDADVEERRRRAHDAARRDRRRAQSLVDAGQEMGLLDAGTARLLSAVYLLGLTGVEAADHLGTTPGSVRVRCSRATARLRAHRDALTAQAA